MQTVVFIIQVVAALVLVALLAVQTDKTEQSGGVMGIGGAGGRATGGVELAVGAERILKPLTTWIAVGFLFSSMMNAMPGGPTPTSFAVFVAIYLFVMFVGGKLWKAFTAMFGS
jgi:protein translocase SecG subunit